MSNITLKRPSLRVLLRRGIRVLSNKNELNDCGRRKKKHGNEIVFFFFFAKTERTVKTWRVIDRFGELRYQKFHWTRHLLDGLCISRPNTTYLAVTSTQILPTFKLKLPSYLEGSVKGSNDDEKLKSTEMRVCVCVFVFVFQQCLIINLTSTSKKCGHKSQSCNQPPRRRRKHGNRFLSVLRWPDRMPCACFALVLCLSCCCMALSRCRQLY